MISQISLLSSSLYSHLPGSLLGDGEGQVCCSPQDHKELETAEPLNNYYFTSPCGCLVVMYNYQDQIRMFNYVPYFSSLAQARHCITIQLLLKSKPQPHFQFLPSISSHINSFTNSVNFVSKIYAKSDTSLFSPCCWS